jgi:hypothetical protein
MTERTKLHQELAEMSIKMGRYSRAIHHIGMMHEEAHKVEAGSPEHHEICKAIHETRGMMRS